MILYNHFWGAYKTFSDIPVKQLLILETTAKLPVIAGHEVAKHDVVVTLVPEY